MDEVSKAANLECVFKKALFGRREVPELLFMLAKLCSFEVILQLVKITIYSNFRKMKKCTRLLCTYITLLLCSLLIYGCCDWEKRTIGADEFVAYTLVEGTKMQYDTIRASFTLRADFETETISMAPEMGLITSSHATSCDPVYLNSLLEESLLVTSDKSMVVAGETIAAGENLVGVAQLDFEIDQDFPSVKLFLTDEELSLFEFTNGWNKIELQIETNDGIQIADELDLYFDF